MEGVRANCRPDRKGNTGYNGGGSGVILLQVHLCILCCWLFCNAGAKEVERRTDKTEIGDCIQSLSWYCALGREEEATKAIKRVSCPAV